MTTPTPKGASSAFDPPPPLLRERDRDAFIAWVQIEAEDHQPEPGGGCTCGFCVWSVDHAIVMAIREVWDFRGWPDYRAIAAKAASTTVPE